MVIARGTRHIMAENQGRVQLDDGPVVALFRSVVTCDWT